MNKIKTKESAGCGHLRSHLQARTELAMSYLLKAPGTRSRRAVIKQLELLIHLVQATVALERGAVTRGSLSPQKRALCLAPVKALEPAADLEAIRRYVHASLLGADVATLHELVRATRSAELVARFSRVAETRPERGQLQLPGATPLEFAA